MIFDNRAQSVITLHDVSKLIENQNLQSENKLIQMVSSSCNHEMLAPIRCIISIVGSLMDRVQDSSLDFDLTVINNTASFLLNQVQSNLNYSLLDQGRLQP
jgi:light-regulated signal transduction histidine kinase (bacteriophytochrome)